MPCQHCPSLLEVSGHFLTSLRPSNKFDSLRLFHSKCLACEREDDEEASLCQFCNHLRIRHLFVCLSQKIIFKINLGDYARLSLEPQCAFCRIVKTAVEAEASKSVERIENISAFTVIISHSYPGLVDADAEYGTVFQANLGFVSRENLMADVEKPAGILWIRERDLKAGLPSASASTDNGPMSCFQSLPKTESMIPWPQFKSHLKKCDSEHETPRSRSSLPHGFRVLDVARRRIVSTAPTRFVALSYVWGIQKPRLKATTKTIQALEQDGGVPASEVSETIEDAIQVCVELGEQFLWVDLLCILQDSREDFINQIQAMDAIYSMANLVLVAAYGNSMSAGLPGVRTPRHTLQSQEVFQGLEVTNSIPNLIDGCPWSSRAWTYQESVLSNRKLYFTSNSYFYECKEHPFSESCSWKRATNNLSHLQTQDEEPFEAYCRHAHFYSKRALTNESDVYNAFAGIGHALYSGDLAFGLPRPAFDHALLWSAPTLHALRSADAAANPLPTWSWCSIKNLCTEEPIVSYWNSTQLWAPTCLFYGSLVCWSEYIGRDEPCMRVIQATDTGMAWYRRTWRGTQTGVGVWQLYMWLAWRLGCIAERPPPDDISKMGWMQNTFAQLAASAQTRWPDYESFWSEAFAQKRDLSENVSEHCLGVWPSMHASMKQQLTPGCLLGLVHIASFRLATSPSRAEGRADDMIVVNESGKRVGNLFEAVDAKRIELEVMPELENPDAVFDFIAISLCGIFSSSPRINDMDGHRRTYHDSENASLDPIPCVNVMLVGRRGEIWHRISLGRILLIDWVEASRRCETIILE